MLNRRDFVLMAASSPLALAARGAYAAKWLSLIAATKSCSESPRCGDVLSCN